MKQISPDLKLLDLTLKNSSAIQYSSMGEFTAPGSQEILVVRPGGAIEVYRIESNNDDEDESRVWLKMMMRVETRSVIRSTEIVRLAGEKRDLVIIGSDSGNVSVMDFEGIQAKILHCPAFGKTGTFRLEIVLCSYMHTDISSPVVWWKLTNACLIIYLYTPQVVAGGRRDST